MKCPLQNTSWSLVTRTLKRWDIRLSAKSLASDRAPGAIIANNPGRRRRRPSPEVLVRARQRQLADPRSAPRPRTRLPVVDRGVVENKRRQRQNKVPAQGSQERLVHGPQFCQLAGARR